MSSQTVTRSIESDAEPARIYILLAEVGNLPPWAPIFADTIEPIDGTRHRITRNGEAFDIDVHLHPSAGTVDYIREMPNGKRGGAYIRVTPRPLGGTTITMTVPLAPNALESDVAQSLEQELADLRLLAQS